MTNTETVKKILEEAIALNPVSILLVLGLAETRQITFHASRGMDEIFAFLNMAQRKVNEKTDELEQNG